MKKLAALSLLFLIAVIIIYFHPMNASSPILPSVKPIRYVALGDSYTIGQGIDPAYAWPNILSGHLKNAGINVQLVANPSQTGWTTQDLINYELPVYKESKPNFATLLIGVNDWVQGVSKEQFRQNFLAILNAMQKELARPQNIIVVTIPDFSVTPTGKAFGAAKDISAGIAEFNSIIIEEAGKKNLPVIDIFEISKDMGKEPNLVASDGLHPSAKEYAIWEQLVYPKALEILSKP